MHSRLEDHNSHGGGHANRRALHGPLGGGGSELRHGGRSLLRQSGRNLRRLHVI